MNWSDAHIQVTNTMTGKKELFRTLVPGEVKFYSCGPTVYNLFHIGNARALLTADLFVRYLRHRGFQVTYVRNFTDVDDKIIKRANEEGVESIEISERYIEEAEADFKALGMIDPDQKPKVTTHMKEIISLIEALLKRGHAYEVNGEVLYSIESMKDYGKLSKRNIDDLVAGARVNPGENKRNPLDFTLWKPAKPGEPFWESPWGKGRPGWHIECSAMSCKYLGETFDIHHGGADLIFPHHENEIAQSEGASGKSFVNYWLHNAYLNISGEKMSKSLGNFILLRDFVKQYGTEVFRYMIYSAHYRTPIDFSEENIQSAISALDRYYGAIQKLEEAAKVSTEKFGSHPESNAKLGSRDWLASFNEEVVGFYRAMDNDFNSAQAFGYLFNLVRLLNQLVDSKKEEDEKLIPTLFARMNRFRGTLKEIFGIFYRTPEEFKSDFDRIRGSGKAFAPDEIDALILKRAEARAARDFKASDEIRDQLLAAGVEIIDSLMGTTWKWK